MSDLLIYKNNTKTNANYLFAVGEFIQDNSKIMLQMQSEDDGIIFTKIEDMVALYRSASQRVIDTCREQQFNNETI